MTSPFPGLTNYHEALFVAEACRSMRDVSSSAEFIRAVMLTCIGADDTPLVYMLTAVEKLVEVRKQIDAQEEQASAVIRAHAAAHEAALCGPQTPRLDALMTGRAHKVPR